MLTTEESYPAFRTGNRDYAAGVGGDGQEHDELEEGRGSARVWDDMGRRTR